jgi:sensor domain CHASE-containing protein
LALNANDEKCSTRTTNTPIHDAIRNNNQRVYKKQWRQRIEKPNRILNHQHEASHTRHPSWIPWKATRIHNSKTEIAKATIPNTLHYSMADGVLYLDNSGVFVFECPVEQRTAF